MIIGLLISISLGVLSGIVTGFNDGWMCVKLEKRLKKGFVKFHHVEHNRNKYPLIWFNIRIGAVIFNNILFYVGLVLAGVLIPRLIQNEGFTLGEKIWLMFLYTAFLGSLRWASNRAWTTAEESRKLALKRYVKKGELK